MKVCAIICEFNPFHNGHEYIIREAKIRTNCDCLLLVMSGDFVQRAEPAIVNKHLRAKFALNNGADIVIELPVLYSTANAEKFAFGAINILSQIKNITHIAFGCENEDINILSVIAKIQANETFEFKSILNTFLSDGLSYAKSYTKTTSKFAKISGFDSSVCDIILSKPNNLLAIEYLKQIFKLNLNIAAVPIKRIGSEYNDNIIKNSFSSASAIRNELLKNDNILNDTNKAIAQNIPQNCLEELLFALEHNRVDEKKFETLVVNCIRNNELSGLFDAGEGLENKLKKNSYEYLDLKNIIERTKSKRYTLGRIKRLCLQSLFNIQKNTYNNIDKVPLKLLGIKQNKKTIIKELSNSFIVQNKDYEKLNDNYKTYIDIEKKASNIYSLITNTTGNSFYNNKLITV